MTTKTKKTLEKIVHDLANMDYIRTSDVPEIQLYMDQVTTFMDARLASTKRGEEDKVLTKTMINNYAKNHLLPPPDRKKYSKEHMLILIFIYYFKSILSIRDIDKILKPITDRYFNGKGAITITEIYQEVSTNQSRKVMREETSIEGALKLAENTFTDVPAEDQEYLQIFSLICSLSFDVYMKKIFIEKIIDQFSPAPDEKK
ncbi:MAG: DUF1836 domain-containing protein [Lachnospiraceae bacterium]|nr:DUF1836 domain-containing protein [Lachnospiraceae bacterium]